MVAVEPDRVTLADGSGIPAAMIIAATGCGTDLDGLVGHLASWTNTATYPADSPRASATEVAAIGYGIPPNGPLRAIRRAASPLAREIAAYLAVAADEVPVTSTTPGEQRLHNSRLTW